MIDENGYYAKPKADIHAEQLQEMQHELGTDADLSSGSFSGKIVDYETENLFKIQQASQKLYDAISVLTATGIQLDRLASNRGIHRNSSERAEALLFIVGKPGYLIHEGTAFGTDDADYFTTENDVTIQSLSDLHDEFNADELTLSQTEQDVLNEQITSAEQQAEKSAQGESPVQVNSAVEDAINNTGVAFVMVISDVAASYENVDKNTIIDPVEPVEEIESVTNPEPAFGGEDLETDYDLRNRIIQNMKSYPGPTPEGLQTAITNLPGVNNVTRQVNTSGKPDSNGNPSHSIHLFINGGKPEDIFDTLAKDAADGTTFASTNNTLDTKASKYSARQTIINGKKTTVHNNGTSHSALVDIYGSKVPVAYDDAIPKYLTFDIKLVPGSGYSSDSIEQSVADFVNSFDMGQPIIMNKLFMALYELTGVSDVESIQAQDDTGKTYSEADKIYMNTNQTGLVNDPDNDVKITLDRGEN